MLHFKNLVPSLLTHSLASMILLSPLLGTSRGYAADLLPLGSLDTSEGSRLATPKPIDKGGVVIRAMWERMHDVTLPAYYGLLGPQSRGLSQIDRSTVTVGYGAHRAVSLFLSISGTSEDLSAELRESFWSPQTTGSTANSNLTSGILAYKQPAGFNGALSFAGASLAVKVSLWHRPERGGLSVAMMPFVESGVGEKGTYALTRAVEPRGGVSLLAGLTAPHKGELTSQIGIRYRFPEEVGQVRLRHEVFYKTRGALVVTDALSVYSEAEGRQFMVANRADSTLGSSIYKPTYGADGRLGLSYAGQSLIVSAFGGGRLGPDDGLGFGSRHLGTSISFLLGASTKYKNFTSYATMVEEQEKQKARLQKGGESSFKGVSTGQNSYPEMIGGDGIDPLDALGTENAPDFKDVKKIMEEERRNAGVESEDARIERELREIREAEAKARAEEDREKAEEEKEHRQKARKEAVEDDKKFKKWLKEAEEELNQMEGFEPGDFEWNGLEH